MERIVTRMRIKFGTAIFCHMPDTAEFCQEVFIRIDPCHTAPIRLVLKFRDGSNWVIPVYKKSRFMNIINTLLWCVWCL